MNAIIYRVSLDMLATLSQVTIKAKKGDSACKIHITLTKNGKIYKISEGCHATFNAKKSDGNFIYNRCTIEGDTIVYDFSSSIDEDGICQVSACEGNVECEVTLYDANGKQLTSSRFILFIDGTVYNGEDIVSSPQTDAFKELINDIETKLENGEFVGKPGEKGDKGDSYILTAEDMSEIATLVPTHEKYFDITESGIISLKSKYRGAAYLKFSALDSGVGAGKIPDAVSDRGESIVGSKNHELPSEIYIPSTVNGIAVTGLATGIFAYNDRIKRVVLQPNIKVLNGYTFCRARNLEAVECIEQIKTVNNCEFFFTPIKKVELPNLTGKLAQSIFNCCPLLEYVDIGDVDEIGKTAFRFAYNLREIKIVTPVVSIGDGAFNFCYNLRTVDNLVAPSVTTKIGKGAFMMSRPTYNWSSLTNCTFDAYATSDQMNPNTDLTGVPFVPCENKALSFLSQFDLRWQEIVVDPDTNETFGEGCAAFSVMGSWCSLNNVTVDDARDFLKICEKYGTDFKYVVGNYYSDATTLPFYDAMGLVAQNVSTNSFTTESATSLVSIYNALAEGKYVVFTVPNQYERKDSNPSGIYQGHAVAITGITPMGEFIIQDSGDTGFWQFGIRGNVTGKIPIQNLINTAAYKYGLKATILSKKAVT